MADLKELENKISYEFKNKELLKNALVHSSYASEHGYKYSENNERMEFIGDAYLDAVVGYELFKLNRPAHEGELSRDRADVVCESSLADVARSIDLGKYIFLGRGEIANHGEQKESILSDTFEALLGAIMIDGGYLEVEKVVLKLFGNQIKLANEGKLNRDFKSKLQEKLQSKYKNIQIKYVLKSETGPDHDKTFNVDVIVNDKILGKGSGKSKAKAEQAAAKDVLSKGEI